MRRVAVEEAVVAVRVREIAEHVKLGVAINWHADVPRCTNAGSLGPSPGLGQRVAWIRAVIANKGRTGVNGRLGRCGLEASDQLFVVSPLGAEVEKTAITQRQTDIAGHLERGFVSVELTELRFEAAALIVVAKNEVDDARDRIGSVL